MYGKLAPSARRALGLAAPTALKGTLHQDQHLRAQEVVTLCHATGSADSPFVQMTVPVVSAHEAHAGDIIPAPSTGCRTCGAITEPQRCSNTQGCKFERSCGCIASACICNDACCISGVCSGVATGISLKSKEPCQLFSPSVRQEGDRAEVLALRFPAGSDSFQHSSLMWLGGDADSDGDARMHVHEAHANLCVPRQARMRIWTYGRARARARAN
jgi:hypothetical protein